MLTSLAAIAALVAVVAVWLTASLAQRLKTISQSHWELRYEFARLRARVAKLDGGRAGEGDADDSASGTTT